MKGLSNKIFNLLIFGVLKRIRTSDLRFRRPLLYPAELSGHMVPLERFELPTFWFVARRAIQLRQRGIWWPKAESNCRHGNFQSPALPAELSSHISTIAAFAHLCLTRANRRNRTVSCHRVLMNELELNQQPGGE